MWVFLPMLVPALTVVLFPMLESSPIVTLLSTRVKGPTETLFPSFAPFDTRAAGWMIVEIITLQRGQQYLP